MFVEVTMRDPDGEIVEYGVATLDVDTFVESHGTIADLSNTRSSAKPDEPWPLPPGYSWTIEVEVSYIVADYKYRRDLRRHERFLIGHGVISTLVGAALMTVFWSSPPAVMFGGGCAGLGLSSILRVLDNRRRRR